MSRLSELFATLPSKAALEYGSSVESGETDPDTGEPIYSRSIAIFSFSKPGFGFGEITIVQKGDVCCVDAETMSRERAIEMLETLLRDAIFDTDKEPEKRAKYEEVMLKK